MFGSIIFSQTQRLLSLGLMLVVSYNLYCVNLFNIILYNMCDMFSKSERFCLNIDLSLLHKVTLCLLCFDGIHNVLRLLL